MLRSEHRLDSLLSRESVFLANNLVLVGLCFVIFWGTYFPLISEAVTGQEASVGPPWFDRYTVPLALILVLLSGHRAGDRLAARDARQRAAQLPRAGRCARWSRWSCCSRAGVREKPLAIAMFCCAAFVLGSIGQEFWRGARVRRAMAGEPRPLALLALVRRNRRRYGGYIVHVGIAVLFVGVAASSSFQHATELGLSPGQSTRVGAYTDPLRAAHRDVTPRYDAAHTGATLSLGAVLDVTKDGHHVATLDPSEGFYASERTRPGIGRQPDRRSARQPRRDERAGSRATCGRAIEPDIEAPRAAARSSTLGNSDAAARRGDRRRSRYLARAYLQHPPPAQFNLIVSPLVMWIWIGGLIVVGGGLIAIWPAPSAVRRRVGARSRARAVAGLARA